jgi:hypothetical protein
MDDWSVEQIFDELEGDEHALKMDGFDDCIVGLATVGGQWVLVYDSAEVIDKMVDQGMTYHEALEFKSFNQDGYLGSGTPIFLEAVVMNKIE